MQNFKKKNASGPWNYFNDCAICQGMKQGRGQTAEELKKLFDEAEVKQTVNSDERA